MGSDLLSHVTCLIIPDKLEINISENSVLSPRVSSLMSVRGNYIFIYSAALRSKERRGEITKVFKGPSGRITIMTPSSDSW